MYRILTLNNIAQKGLDRLPPGQFQQVSGETEPDAILLRSHQLAAEQLHNGLLAIGRAGAGVNNIPVSACTGKGIVVFNTPGANANAVKELVLASILLSGRDVLGAVRFVREMSLDLSQKELTQQVEQGKKQFGGPELKGRTLGVVGLGSIGSLVAGAALSLGMKVTGFDPGLSPEAAERLHPEIERVHDLLQLAARADIITLHVPVLESTRGLVNETLLARCRPGLTLINFARKEVVQPEHLLAALKAGRVRSYLSDFPLRLLHGQPGVITMPHLGASTPEAEQNCAIMVADQLVDFILNGNITNSVNFPHAKLERTEGYRLAFSNHNVPRILGQVLSVLAERNINVIDMLNKSRGEIAYNIIDMETAPDAGLLAEVMAIEGVIGARRVEDGLATG